MSRTKKRIGDPIFRNILRSIFDRKTGPDGRSYTKVHAAIVRRPFQGVVTTNYDPSLLDARRELRHDVKESSYATWKDQDLVSDWRRGAAFGPGRCPILYAHGIHERTDTIVLGAEEYRTAYATSPWRELFQQLWSNHDLVCIGFGFSDPWLDYIVDEVLPRLPAVEPLHVGLIGLDEEYSPERRRLFQNAYGIEPLFYPVGPGHNHSALLHILDALPVVEPTSDDIVLSTGWKVIDRAALARIRAVPPSAEVMTGFFDGRVPIWQHVLADGVRPRKVVDNLATRLRGAHRNPPKPSVLLLSAAGGEGKSTAILHAAAAVVEDGHQAWTCLHRFSATAQVPVDLFSRLRKESGHAWVVVVDDADNVGWPLLEALKRLVPRTDVHLLLAARDAEWRMKRLAPGHWEPVADFRLVPLPPLDREDASRIVAGWWAWGDEAKGKFRGRPEAAAADALVKHARQHAADPNDGALLGALLFVRYGHDMRGHVRALLNGLGRERVVKGKFSLREVYAMVAAMHAENQLYLSRSVLAYALGCEPEELQRDVLGVLRREAMLDVGDTYVITRHRRIAEAACEVMREDGERVDIWYPFLARAARRDFKTDRTRDAADMVAWNYRLAEHFAAKGEGGWPVARVVAKMVYEADSADWHLLTAYSSILRRTNQPGKAMEVLKAAGERFGERRDVLYEWGTVAGAEKDYGLNAWLGGRSLADGGGSALSEQTCKLALAGLGVAFRELFAKHGHAGFIRAQAACGQLGLSFSELNEKDRRFFEKHAAEGRARGVSDLTNEQAVAALQDGVVLGAREALREHDPAYFRRLLGDPAGYGYTSVLRFTAKRGAA